jgi:uncharacterized OB-fold protein
VTNHPKPLPVPDELSRAYWEGAREHRLMVQRCASCARFVHHPKASCPFCGGRELRPTAVSGRGVVYAYTVSHYVGAPGFEQETPYAVVLVDLEEQAGLRVAGNLRGCPPAAVRVGMPVEATFEEVAPGVVLPQFRALS